MELKGTMLREISQMGKTIILRFHPYIEDKNLINKQTKQKNKINK